MDTPFTDATYLQTHSHGVCRVHGYISSLPLSPSSLPLTCVCILLLRYTLTLTAAHSFRPPANPISAMPNMYTHLLFEHAAPIAPNMTELGAYMMKVGAQTAMFDLVKFLEVGETTVHCVKLNDESPL